MSIPESVVLEMFSRMQSCEEEVRNLKREVNALKQLRNKPQSEKIIEDTDGVLTEYENKRKTGEFIGRAEAREIVVSKIQKLIPDVTVRSANRSEGSGIIVQNKKIQMKYKFYNSKCYDQNSQRISWSGVQKSDVDSDFDGFIFSIQKDGELFVLLFSQQQLVDLISSASREYDSNKKYHFSFAIQPDLQVLETRGPSYVNVSFSLNNFNIIQLQ